MVGKKQVLKERPTVLARQAPICGIMCAARPRFHHAVVSSSEADPQERVCLNPWGDTGGSEMVEVFYGKV